MGVGKKIWDLKDYPQLQGKRWMLIASEADSEGSLYFSHLKGISPCLPSSVRLLKFDRKGVLKWNVGRKARGLKDKPGEFMSVICLAGIKRGIVFALEYEGRVDLYTTDGLYLATLLNGTIEDDTPYANWGENFAGDVVEDPKTGDLLFVINTHNYRLPIFKVTGLETIKRTTGKVTLAEPMRAWLAQQPGKVGEKRKPSMTFIYHLGKDRVTIDGKLDEWKGIPHTTATFPDERSKDHYARARAGSDGENLYLAYSVGDPTPAVNRCTAPSVLWDGDCLELYLSPNIDLHAPWKKGDHIIHFSATEDRKKTPVGVLHRTVKTWATPPGIVRGVRIWHNGRGYDLEAKIPFRALGMSSLQLGQLIHLDWDFTYGGKDGKVSFKLAWTDVGHRVLNDPNSWAFGRYVQKVGGENEIFVASASMNMDGSFDGWKEIPVQSRIEIAESEDQFRAELKAASDEKFLYLYFDVADPNPAKVTPGASWVGTGDHIEMFIRSRRIYIPASPAFNSPYILQGAKAEKITDSRMNLQTKKNGDGYELAIAIPWSAIGGKQASLKFNWQVGWSDASGGSIFTVQPWLPWGKESGMLRSAE